MDVQDKLDALAELIEQARALPMSASCVVNRAEVLDLIEEIRSGLPTALFAAEDLLSQREELVAQGRAEADRIVDAAYVDQARLIGETEVYRQAEIEAERMVYEAGTESARIQQEGDDYIDARLANFEIVLQKTLATVERGRAKLSADRDEAAGDVSGGPAAEGDPEAADDPQPEDQQER